MGLFNRPTSTATGNAGSSSDKPADMFSHSQTYNQILAEQEQRRKEKLAKQGRKREGKRKSDEGTADSPVVKKRDSPKRKGEESPKRRRISGSDINGLLKEAGIFGGTIDDESEDEQIAMEPSSQKKLSPRKKREDIRLTRSSSKSNAVDHDDTEIIEVGESSGDDTRAKDAQVSYQSALADEDEESDEELAALAREARQRRLQQTQSATPDVAANSSMSQVKNTGSPQAFFETSALPDPAVKILIVSRISNTNPLLVYRKLSQDLKDVRRAWCQRQGFDSHRTNLVFLIHRTRRVYDSTTVRSLGLETDPEGNISMEGAEGKEGVDQVALEAVTDDIFASILAEKARGDAKRLGQWDDPGAEESTSAPEPAAEELIGIVLKAKGKPDFKLKVKPSTPFSKIINACRKTFQVPDGSSITLDFDGDQLDPDDTVNSTEISDLDVVDVHVS